MLLADDDQLLVLEEDARGVEVADAQLRPLEIGDQRKRLAGLGLDLTHDRRAGGMGLVVAVREVETDRIDTRVDERAKRVMRR